MQVRNWTAEKRYDSAHGHQQYTVLCVTVLRKEVPGQRVAGPLFPANLDPRIDPR